MIKKSGIFYELFYAIVLAIAITTPALSQDKEIFTITSDDANSLKKKFDDNVFVYEIKQQEVNEYVHKKELNRLSSIFSKNSMSDKLQSKTEQYERNIKYYNSQKSAISSIKNNIDSYFLSDEKPKNKQQFLIDAQKIADDNSIEITIQQREVIKNNVNNHYRREIDVKGRLTEENRKPVSDEVIQKYLNELNNFIIKYPTKPYEIKLKAQIDSLSAINTKRLVYLVPSDDVSIKIDDLIGNFTLVSEKYFNCAESNYEYTKYELTDAQNNSNCGKIKNNKYPILLNVDTNLTYVIFADSYLLMVQDLKDSKEMIRIVNNAGYKENYDKDGFAYINTKTAKIPLGYWLKTELKKDKNFISNFDNEQLKIASLKSQTPPHSKTLDKFLGQYRIQRNKMLTSDINAWRNATISAKKLFDQIYKLNEKYISNYNFTLLKESTTYESFLDNLNASRGVIGI